MSIALACLLTVLLETPYMYLVGYRGRNAVTIVVCANVVSNLLLNLTLLLAFPDGAGAWVYLLEALVVAAEFGVYSLAFGPSWRLLLFTFLANCLSYCAGLLIFANLT